MSKFLTIDDVVAYKISSELSDWVWNIVIKWDFFAKKTVGDQLVRAVDSIAANIAEGFGRYHKKDKIKFYYNARGSLIESIHWVNKSNVRNLLTKDEFNYIINILNNLPREINYLIKITEIKLSQ